MTYVVLLWFLLQFVGCFLKVINLPLSHYIFFKLTTGMLFLKSMIQFTDDVENKNLIERNEVIKEEPLSMPPLSEPVSMPPLLSSSSSGGFSYRNPAYRSANPSAVVKSKNSLSEVRLMITFFLASLSHSLCVWIINFL